MKKALEKPLIRTTGLIALCFLLTSTGWLSWEYHLLDQISVGASDIYTMVIGYLLQAAGIGICAVLYKTRSVFAVRMLPVAAVLHMVCMFPAVRSPYVSGTLAFGFLMNVFCGVIAGSYLYALARNIPGECKAAVFGGGYAIAIVGSWLLSRIGNGSVYYSGTVLLICLVLTAAVIALSVREKSVDGVAGSDGSDQDAERPVETGKPVKRSFLLLAGVLVLLFSIVNSSGFAFPAADLGAGINIELSRLVYAAGLVIAGFVTDRNRKYGAVAALTALMIPFIILALRGESLSVIIFWLLSYFTFGFYAVYRIVLFSDIASEKGLLYLSGFGLLAGRIGDAVGETICILLGGHLPVVVILTAVLFGAAVAVFFKLYPILYVPETMRQWTEEERFAQFSASHDLSAREQDMLRLLLERKSNAEIADTLSISENTVKFHVRNLLQKTGCRNRQVLLNVYTSYGVASQHPLQSE